MERVNLVMMGLRGLILLIVQEYQHHPKRESARYILGRYLNHKLSKKSIEGFTMIELVNAVVAVAEEKGVEADMREAAKEMILDSRHDIELLLITFLETETGNTVHNEIYYNTKKAI